MCVYMDMGDFPESNVVGMGAMFWESQFNQNISQWNLSGVTTMAYMFQESQFNQNISEWDVSNVSDER